MKLLTKEIEARLAKSPLGSQEHNQTPTIIVKFFDPTGSWTWYATEGSKTEDGDWEFFGLVDGHEKELGYFVLSELASVRGRFGLGIERDMHFDGHRLNLTGDTPIVERIPKVPGGFISDEAWSQ